MRVDELTIEVLPDDLLVEKLQEMWEAAEALNLLNDYLILCPKRCVGQVVQFEPKYRDGYSNFAKDRRDGSWYIVDYHCLPISDKALPCTCKVKDYFDGGPFMIWHYKRGCIGQKI